MVVLTIALVLSLIVLAVFSITLWCVSRENKELKITNLQLQQLDRQKTEFLSIAAHQFRTPLSVISGYLELIKDGVYGESVEDLSQALNNVNKNNERLIKLVDEFLTITRLDQGMAQYIFVPTNLNEIVESVIADLTDQAQTKGLTLRSLPNPIPPVLVDVDCIRHVLNNLIDNAIQYSDRGDIVVTTLPTEDGVSVQVTDQGVGFEASDKEHFFQKFYRGKNVQESM